MQYRVQTDMDNLKNIADMLKDKLPTLLSSYRGLYVACAVFNILESKDRKVAIKSLKEAVKEML